MPFISSNIFRNSIISSRNQKNDVKGHEETSQTPDETIRILREENEILKAVLANPTDFTDVPDTLPHETKLLIAGIKIRYQDLQSEIADLNEELIDLKAQNTTLQRTVASERFYIEDVSRQRLEIQRLHGIAEAEVHRLRSFEAEALRLAPYEDEANRLRPQIGQLRDMTRESDRSKRTAEEKVSTLEAESKKRALRFAHVQQLLLETMAIGKHQVSPQLRSLHVQLAGARTQLTRLATYRTKADHTWQANVQLRQRLESTQHELDTAKSFVNALQKRFQDDAFALALDGAKRHKTALSPRTIGN
ncbi:uncharacterized protein BDZ99DRAFT_576374 [Mytilinidion resinicola]|uniref:Uncharacterized protein n=1 Tax=Mytilinidion resinicola TaxID=574789 RepID=A0A6A6Y4F9_9PEZI|nr:uncharacterized protein BDZ99DRAFT_576374 [Mytilinidion resinicola]KAF2803115.1 hypothetical protein BDZ99DRAFT_576374 [Mytilinidion resinicola]